MKTILRVLPWLKRHPWLAAAQIFFAVAGTLVVLVPPRAVSVIIDEVIKGGREELLMPWVLLAAAAYFGRDLFNAMRIRCNNTLEQHVIFDIRSDLYRRLQQLPLPWFDQKPTGDLMTTVAEDVTSMERVLVDGVDISLVDAEGKELDMGTGWDFMDPSSATEYPALPETARRNRLMLKSLMAAHGFRNYAGEWWHYTLEEEPWPDRYFDVPVR